MNVRSRVSVLLCSGAFALSLAMGLVGLAEAAKSEHVMQPSPGGSWCDFFEDPPEGTVDNPGASLPDNTGPGFVPPKFKARSTVATPTPTPPPAGGSPILDDGDPAAEC